VDWDRAEKLELKHKVQILEFLERREDDVKGLMLSANVIVITNSGKPTNYLWRRRGCAFKS